jgi:hypothetical protein
MATKREYDEQCDLIDSVSKLTKERDILKEALRLACELLADDICPIEVVGEYICPKTHMTYKRDASGELEECNEDICGCWQSNFIAQAKSSGISAAKEKEQP